MWSGNVMTMLQNLANLSGFAKADAGLIYQMSREFNVSDQTIDMEIELIDDAHEATGAKLYLQRNQAGTAERRSPSRRVS